MCLRRAFLANHRFWLLPGNDGRDLRLEQIEDELEKAACIIGRSFYEKEAYRLERLQGRLIIAMPMRIQIYQNHLIMIPT